MDINQLNTSTRSNSRQVAIKSSIQYRIDGAKNAYSGLDDAVYNHSARWLGYSNDQPIVEANGIIHVVNTFNGMRGIPWGTSVVLRIAKGYKVADFS